MEVIVYGKEGCPACMFVKDKLKKLNIEHVYRTDTEEFLSYHEGWRNDGSVEVKAYSELVEGALPFIKINGKFYSIEDYLNAIENL